MDEIQSGYNRWASVYDSDGNPLMALEEPAMRAAVGNPDGLDVLDLGCGTGRHALWLAEHGASVIALDFSEGMLAEARRKPGADRVRWMVHDLAQALPFADRSFDLVVNGLVMEHIEELDLFFSESRRVLRPGGRAVITAMRFTDPQTGELVQPGSFNHSIGQFVMAAVRSGFTLQAVEEKAPDRELAQSVPRAAKYVDWPMLVVLELLAGR